MRVPHIFWCAGRHLEQVVPLPGPCKQHLHSKCRGSKGELDVKIACTRALTGRAGETQGRTTSDQTSCDQTWVQAPTFRLHYTQPYPTSELWMPARCTYQPNSGGAKHEGRCLRRGIGAWEV